jgi:glycosyltransferase involved in cell wall biosynthesis
MPTNYDTSRQFFSVVIPTYNCDEYLERALKSVFSQTYQDFEVIVVDNSSTDNTQNVLGSFPQDKLKVITVNNRGIIAYSRNEGIKKAKGEWVAFLDSDDVWQSEKLEKVKNAIDENQGFILICHDEWCVMNGKNKNRLSYGPSGDDMYDRLLFKINCLSTSAVCVKKDILIKTGGFSERNDFVTAEDYEYWIRLSQVGEFYFIKEVLGEYHIHGKNTVSNVKVHNNAVIAIKKYHYDLWLKIFPHKYKKVKRGFGKMWTEVASGYMKAGEYDDASKYALKAIAFTPFYWKVWVVLFLGLFRIKISY